MKFAAKVLSRLGVATACLMMMFNTGCASGGFKLTREYAGFVNRQQLILRIIIYIFTSVVFAVTMLIDLVVFNTMDFWDGRVSAGDYQFQNGDKTYFAHHEVLPNGLKRSTINIKNKNGEVLQNVVLAETASSQIEVFVDGKMKMRVDHIREAPIALSFDDHGTLLKKMAIQSSEMLAAR